MTMTDDKRAKRQARKAEFLRSRGRQLLKQKTAAPELTRASIAAQCGVSPQTVSEWIEGDVVPDAVNLKVLADLLGEPMEAFFEDGGEA